MTGEKTEPTRLTIYLPLPMVQASEQTLAQLVELAARLDIACVVLELSYALAADEQAERLLDELVSGLQKMNIAVLAGIDQIALFLAPNGPDLKAFEAQLQRAIRLGCDGIHLSADEHLVAEARKQLPGDNIIGVLCGASRHQAMLMAEQGADYIAFSKPEEGDAEPFGDVVDTTELDESNMSLIELIEWWQRLFEVPCVAWGLLDAEQIRLLTELPADFIAPDATLLTDASVTAILEQHCGARQEAS